ncbi:MAG TPA: M14-type cytosolic carboxypeptidase, partial [Opitutus sp.]|nr:M14-type cytosolic carboxypeptidase [Opitutus sp.]
MMRARQAYVGALAWAMFACGLTFASDSAPRDSREPILFNTAFEGASLGEIEAIDATTFRLHVRGQQDERGRNRQATWYFFRMDRVAGREITLTFTDWVGEYNDIPGTVPMSAKLRPWISEDQKHWRPIEQMVWDADRKEATVTVRAKSDRVWLAHLQPYSHSRLLGLLDELNQSAAARIEVIGKTVLGRDLHLITVTDFAQPNAGKKTVWLQARQHAWETGTSFVMEGALRFITSDDPRARELRRHTIFKFTPMLDPDGCANGGVRFNANGYDLNRHWERVDLRDPAALRAMPESWYLKKAIVGHLHAGGG